jgi:hypothetical protein
VGLSMNAVIMMNLVFDGGDEAWRGVTEQMTDSLGVADHALCRPATCPQRTNNVVLRKYMNSRNTEEQLKQIPIVPITLILGLLNDAFDS